MSLRFKILRYLKKPENIITLILIAALFFLTLMPLITMIEDTFTVHTSEIRRIRSVENIEVNEGDFTLNHWKTVFTDKNSYKSFYEPLLNSIICSLGACFFSLSIGGLFAWFITRTNLRWKSTLSTLFLFPYIMPAWTLALAWQNLFKNSLVGGTAGIFTALTGIEVPNWFAYGQFPIALVQGLHYAPFAYILIGGILRNMDANLEEAALILKSSRARIFSKITIPIIMPAVLSTFLLTFSSTMSGFAVPSFLGLPVRYYVLTTQLYRTLNGGTSPGQGYVIAMVLIFLGTLILFLNQMVLGSRKAFTTVTGKSANIALVNLKHGRNLLSVLILVIVVSVSIIPLISFAVESLMVVPGKYTLDNLTLNFWIGSAEQNALASNEPGVLLNPVNWRVLWNSLKLSIIASLGAGTFGFLAGYAIVRGRGTKLSRVLDNLTFFPYLMPSMAFGAIYLSMFSVQRGPIPSLYGTFSLLVLIAVVKYIPFASRAGINSMHQLSKQIEEAGEILGLSWFKRITKLVIPIQKSSFISGYLLPFTSCMRELSLFVLLITPQTRVLTTMLYYYNEKGWSQYSNAINLIIVLIVLFLNKLVNKITGASIDKGIGG